MEKSKSRPNMDIVNELMSVSFAMRRQDFLENVCDITKVLGKYLFLGTSDQVHETLIVLIVIMFIHISYLMK